MNITSNYDKDNSMEKETWTSADLRSIFRIDERYKSIQTLFNAEERGEIPKAARVSRGKVQVRHWELNQLPDIGKRFGFLERPANQIVISKYIQKGGVLKTTTSYNEARIYALNGLKTLIIGLDFECSITDVILPKADVISLEDNQKFIGLYQFLAEDAPLKDIIKKTSLPTLDLIPETHDLVVLDKWLNQQKRREYIFRDKLLPLLSEYDVIIFDNGPSWNHLIENSITTSNVIICPLGCNLLAYNASETNLSSIFDFQKIMNLLNQKIIMFPTLLERSSLSQQIYAQYLSRFNEYIIPIPIRMSVKGQEALVCKKSILEYAPNSSLAQDYYELILAIWQKITNKSSAYKLAQGE
jgi:chromosome partitioning protein